MLFVLYCRDKPDSRELRLATRASHLDYAKAADCIRMAGPMLGDDGESMIGSLFVIDVSDLAAAKAFNTDDPYTRAGLWGSVAIHPFRWLLPTPDGKPVAS